MALQHYVIMFVMLALAAVFCYVFIFSALAMYDRALALRFVPLINEVGADNVDELAAKMSCKPQTVKKLVIKCRKWRYVD